jgi:SagB-type dehydrogenase family enzyme
MIDIEDPTTLSLLFHLNSEPWLNDEAYTTAGAPPELEPGRRVLEELRLPEAASTPLTALVAERRSCRAFAEREMTLETVAALLAAGYGVVDGSPAGPGLQRRAVPSAGGLFPLEIFAILRQVNGVPDGLYRYVAPGHSLQLLRVGDLLMPLADAFYTYPFIRGCNLVLMMAAVFQRTQKKYGPRGYRYILIEAGHVGQNVCLRAVELGLSTLCMGGFVDSRLVATLGLDPRRGGVVYTLAAGYAAPS